MVYLSKYSFYLLLIIQILIFAVTSPISLSLSGNFTRESPLTSLASILVGSQIMCFFPLPISWRSSCIFILYLQYSHMTEPETENFVTELLEFHINQIVGWIRLCIPLIIHLWVFVPPSFLSTSWPMSLMSPRLFFVLKEITSDGATWINSLTLVLTKQNFDSLRREVTMRSPSLCLVNKELNSAWLVLISRFFLFFPWSTPHMRDGYRSASTYPGPV